MLFLLGFYDRFLGIARESLTLMSPKKIYNWDLIDLKAWIIWKNPLLAFKFLTKKAVMYPSSQKAITQKKKKKKKERVSLIIFKQLRLYGRTCIKILKQKLFLKALWAAKTSPFLELFYVFNFFNLLCS